jgi:uncharacterized membrane protein YdjX (TVP38/TMEM64 family)
MNTDTTISNLPDTVLLFVQRHRQKFIVVGLWLLILAGFWVYTGQNNLSPREAARQLSHFLQSNIYGPFFFVAIYLVRPLVLFPTAVMTMLAGFLFGPVWGVVYAMAGNLASAMVAYGMGHYVGQGLLESRKSEGLASRYTNYLRRNSFEAVLTMRLILLHFDTVSYVAGFLRVNWRGFLLATGLGSLAGVVSYVLAGASIEGNFDGSLSSLDPRMLAVAVLLFVASFGLAWLLRGKN